MENSLGSPAVPENDRVDRLAPVKHGQDVFDKHGKRVGKVDTVYAGSWDQRPGTHVPVEGTVMPLPLQPNTQTAPPMEAVVPVPATVSVPEFDSFFGPQDDLPKELRARLEHDGFVRIDAGMLHHHRFALRDQVAQVEGDRVHLNVADDELVKH